MTSRPGRLEGRVAVVTGGASGLGEATVRRFVSEGASCVIADRQADRGRALVTELGDATRFVLSDVTLEADVAAMVDLAVADFGRLDVMFNNAGVVGAVGPVAETSIEAWNGTIAVLLSAVFLGMKHAARVMIPQGSGVILSTSSTAGVTGGLGPHAYSAAKHGVVGLTKSVASELAQHGIRVNAIAPGSTATPMIADVVAGDPSDMAAARRYLVESSPLRRAAVADDIAAAALYLASDDAANVTGHCLVVDGGQTTGASPSRFHSQPAGVIAEAGRRSLEAQP